MPQNWVEKNGVKMNIEIADFLDKNHFFIAFYEDDGEEVENGSANTITTSDKVKKGFYPWIVYVPATCRSCGKSVCPCLRPHVRYRVLHVFTWDFFFQHTNPRKNGEHIHHLRGNKRDARIKMLRKLTPHQHGLVHRLNRQKFSKRERDFLADFNYRPRLPAKVVSRPDLIGTTMMPTPKLPPVPSKEKRVQEMEKRLATLFETLVPQVQHLDSGAELPKSTPLAAWRSPKTRMLGITVPKMELSLGQRSFMLLLVKNKFDMAAVALETGEHPALLKELYKRPAVSVAVELWHKKKILPLAP